jgi:molybdopterin converting factor small subunit
LPHKRHRLDPPFQKTYYYSHEIVLSGTTMNIQVGYYSTFRSLTCKKKDAFELEEGSSIQVLLDSIQTNIRKGKPQLTAQSSVPYSDFSPNSIMVFLNDSHEKNFDTVLKDGDRVNIFGAVSGG